MDKKQVSVLLMGYNGENNTGAESRLVTIAKDVRETLGKDYDLKMYAVAYEIPKVRRYLKDPDVELYEIGNPKQLATTLPKVIRTVFDVLVLVEGSTFTDHFSPQLLWSFMFAALVHHWKGHKTCAYAVDALELTPQSQKLVKYAGNKIDFIFTRNADARDLLVKYGIRKEIQVTTDTAFQYQPPPKDVTRKLIERMGLDPDKPLIGIAPKEFYWWPVKPKLWAPAEDKYRFWPLYHTWGPGDKQKSLVFKGHMCHYADWLVENLDANIVLIAMERMDEPPAQDILTLMKHKDRARVVASNDYDLDDISGILGRLKFLVSTRYHACVLSMVSAIPMIGVSHDSRIESLYKELGHMDYYVNYETPDLFEVLMGKTKKLLSEEDQMKDRIRDEYQRYLKLCLKNRDIFREWFDREVAPTL